MGSCERPSDLVKAREEKERAECGDRVEAADNEEGVVDLLRGHNEVDVVFDDHEHNPCHRKEERAVVEGLFLLVELVDGAELGGKDGGLELDALRERLGVLGRHANRL